MTDRDARQLTYLKTAANIAAQADAADRLLTDRERADVARLMKKARSAAR